MINSERYNDELKAYAEEIATLLRAFDGATFLVSGAAEIVELKV